MKNLLVIIALTICFNQTIVAQESNKNALSFTFLRIQEYTLPVHPRFTFGVSHQYFFKPNLSLIYGVEGNFSKYENPIKNSSTYNYYKGRSGEIQFFFGYNYILNSKSAKKVKYYIGTNIFYEYRHQIGEFFSYNQVEAVDVSEFNLYYSGIQQNFGVKFYLTQKFYLNTEIATKVGYYKNVITPTYQISGLKFKPLIFRLKLGFEF